MPRKLTTYHVVYSHIELLSDKPDIETPVQAYNLTEVCIMAQAMAAPKDYELIGILNADKTSWID